MPSADFQITETTPANLTVEVDDVEGFEFFFDQSDKFVLGNGFGKGADEAELKAEELLPAMREALEAMGSNLEAAERLEIEEARQRVEEEP